MRNNTLGYFLVDSR